LRGLAGAGQLGAVPDDPGVGLRAEAEREGLAVAVDDEADGGGGLADGVAQQIGGVPEGGPLVVLAGCVQPDHGVEMDHAAFKGAPCGRVATAMGASAHP
jgi:hypothetical protein